MSIAGELKLRRGTTEDHQSFTGGVGEVTVDTDKNTIVVHDGFTLGGHALAKAETVYTKNEVNAILSGEETEATSYTEEEVDVLLAQEAENIRKRAVAYSIALG